MIIGILVWFYLFNIYEVKYILSENSLKSNSTSEIEIVAIPLNSFGSKIPFRNITANFKIIEGDSLVISRKEDRDKLFLKAKQTKGDVIIIASANYGLFPSKIEIEVK